jgi:hypothetical protein
MKSGARTTFVVRALVAALVGVLLLLVAHADPRLLFVKWRDYENLPFDLAGDPELAAKGAPFKRSSLSLVCEATGKLHLVLRTRMAARSFLEALSRDDAVVFIGGDRSRSRHRCGGPGRHGSRRHVGDAPALLELDRLATWFGSSPPGRVGFITMERAVFLAGITSAAPIRALMSGCRDDSRSGRSRQPAASRGSMG